MKFIQIVFLTILFLANSLYAKSQYGPSFHFIKNNGQMAREISFYTLYKKGIVEVTKNGEILYQIEKNGRLVGLREKIGKENIRPLGQDEQNTQINYFIGDKEKWREGVKTFKKLDFSEILPGIRMNLIAHKKGLEKVFFVAPFANPDRIQIKFVGLENMYIDDSGNLVINDGIVVYEKPYAYQNINGRRVFIDVKYKVNGNKYGFLVGEYDKSKPLVIDPLLSATYLGGSLIDAANDIAIDDTTGDVYIIGTTSSPNFPITSGTYDISYNSNQDVFIIVLNRTLTTIKKATFFGGSGIDTGKSIKIDNNSNIFIIGDTTSLNLPTTVNAFSRNYGGSNLPDAFIAKFNKSLSNLLASTYLGGSNGDVAKSIVVDSAGNVYVAGITSSVDFPATIGSHDPTYNGNLDVFLSKLDSSLSSLTLSTFLGGTADDGINGVAINIDLTNGYIFVAGDTTSINFPVTSNAYNTIFSGGLDAFITKLGINDFLIVSSTFLGGTNDDIAKDIVLQVPDNHVFIIGSTNSLNFPTTPGVIDRTLNGNYDTFISVLNLDLETLVASTYLGGSGNDMGKKILMLSDGDLIIGGDTTSINFPVLSNSYDTSFNGSQDIFMARTNPLLTSLKASTFYGGNGFEFINGMAISSEGYVYLSGLTSSTNLPTYQINPDRILSGFQDGFIAKFDKSFSNLNGVITATPLSHDFGGTIIRTTSVTQIFTIKNNGLGELEIGLIKITGKSIFDFQIQSDLCSNKTLLPLEECSITVLFNPKTTGTKTANLIIPSSDISQSQLNIGLTGSGLPAIVLTSPNGGEVLATGSTHTITWNASPGISLVDIQYSLNNGFTWTYITKGQTGTNFIWTVPILPKNSKALIRVIGRDSSNKVLGSDKSNSPFLIEVVKLLTPNGGEVFTSGEIPSTGITWNTNATVSPVSSVKLFISFNNGFTWKLIATISGNPGTYAWTVPTVNRVFKTCKVRVVLINAQNRNVGIDVSDRIFTINPL